MPTPNDDDEPTLPTRSRDDSDEGWGERDERDGRDDRDAEWYRRERPPHHDREA